MGLWFVIFHQTIHSNYFLVIGSHFSVFFSPETYQMHIRPSCDIIQISYLLILYFPFLFLYNAVCVTSIDAFYITFWFHRHFSIYQCLNSLFCCVVLLAGWVLNIGYCKGFYLFIYLINFLKFCWFYLNFVTLLYFPVGSCSDFLLLFYSLLFHRYFHTYIIYFFYLKSMLLLFLLSVCMCVCIWNWKTLCWMKKARYIHTKHILYNVIYMKSNNK